jgi:hypothetical protein
VREDDDDGNEEKHVRLTGNQVHGLFSVVEQERELFIGRRLVGLGCIALGSVVLASVNVV